MESHREMNSCKKFKKDEPEKPPSLLSIFIEYAWEGSFGDIRNCEDWQFINWINSVNIDLDLVKNQSRSAIKNMMKQAKRNNLLTAYYPDENSRNVSIVFKLKRLIGFVIASSNNINYTRSYDGLTILHVFLQEYQTSTSDLSDDQLSRIKHLMKRLIARGASFYTLDKYRRSSLHIAALCPNKQILDLVISCINDGIVNTNDIDKVADSIFEITSSRSDEQILFKIAAAFNNRQIIEAIISKLNVNVNDDNEVPVLHRIFYQCINDDNEHKYLDIIQVLIDNGADVNYQNKQGITSGMSPLHLASQVFYVEAIKLFAVNGGKFDELITNKDETCLHLACKSSVKLREKSKIIETIDLLVSYGCDLKAVDKKGYMPIHYAVEIASIEVIERLLKFDGIVEYRTDKILMTPLHLAAKTGRLDVMRKLIEAGADVNAKAADGTTPIFQATLWGSFECMQYLIERGADLYRRDKFHGFTLLHMAAFGNDTNKNRKMNNEETKLDYLVKMKFDINDSGSCGVSPLQLATVVDNVDGVKTLIKHGADVNYQADETELTALHIASLRKNYQIIEILIELGGANVNCRGGIERWTPLHFALTKEINFKFGKYRDNNAESCQGTSSLLHFWPKFDKVMEDQHLDVITILLSKGADLNFKDSHGRNALHLATLRSGSRITTSILEAGAQPNLQDNEGQLPLVNSLKDCDEPNLTTLLSYGAEIDDDDVKIEIMTSHANMKLTVATHVFKLRMLQLPVVEILEDPIFYESTLHPSCLSEIKALHNYRVGQDFSLYQFLHMKMNRQCQFVEEISNSFQKLKILFPNYFEIIHGVCHYVIHRKSLLQQAKIVWQQVTNIYLPDICIENILSQLSNRYLAWLVDSVKPVERIFIDNGEKPVIHGKIKSIINVFSTV